MWQESKIIINFILICVLYEAKQAANAYSYAQGSNQNFPLPANRFDTVQQQQHIAQQQQQQQQQRISQDYGYQNNNYPYPQTLRDPREYSNRAVYQRKNYGFDQATGSYNIQSRPLSIPVKQQQQNLPYWIIEPSNIADYETERYYQAATSGNAFGNDVRYQLARNKEYNIPTTTIQRPSTPLRPYQDGFSYYRQNPLSSSERINDIALIPEQNTVVPLQSNTFQVAPEYAKHFEQYLRKFPERLQPEYSYRKQI